MLVGRKRTPSSFGSDGRRLNTVGVAPIRKVPPSSSSSSSCYSSAPPKKSSKLFRPGARILVQRAPVMTGLSIPAGLQKKFKRPMTKRRAYDKNAEHALKTCSLGQRRRMDGMSKLMARAGRGLTFKLPQRPSGADDGTSGEDDESDEEDKENEKPFEPLCVWTSPHQGGEAKGLPPALVTEMQSDEYGVEEAVTVLRPASASSYAKENVFVPPVLAKWLRPHQREGVAFMYECVMGLRGFKGNGCILADDMGLGKTLQSVALIYTLIKTSIVSNREPTAKRVIVVCPCSLVKNWENEFTKWLGPGTVKTLALAEADRKTVEKNIDIFVRTKMFNVLIASYECIRAHHKRLTKYKDCCDLLVCDEAHRLKNNENQTSMALNSLPVKRRVLLTGTPMQNDLQEFFAMVDFTNPGVLGSQEEFRKRMLFPILRGREPDATETQKKKMMQIQQDMSNIVNEFILRRINTLNAQHLPPKLVQVVCCNLTEIQKNMYQHLVNSKDMQHVLNGKQENCLGSIQMLMKLCNHPSLIAGTDSSSNFGRSGGRNASKKVKYSEEPTSSAAPGAEGVAKFLPFDDGGGRRGGSPVRPEWSGKMFVLYRLMKEMRKPGNGNDKIVIISNYTQTLDLIGKMCGESSWGFCRLDGGVTMKKRQKMVDEFNDPSSNLVAFLLSSKAGGCGINLIGGNRLVLFDPDWNPAVDKQAAARCWRDGQKKMCFTYRFLATGTVEEKIFQRQLSKEGLQSVVDDKEQVNELSTKDLRNLFKLRHGTPSDTHDKLKCERCKIIADKSEMEDIEVLPRKLEACKKVIDQMFEHEGATMFLGPIKPEEHGVSSEEYEKIVRQPIDLGAIRKRLDLPVGQNGAYKSVSEVSKDVNRIFANVVKVWSPGQDIADAARRLQSWWIEQWTDLVPILMTMKADDEQPKSGSSDGGVEMSLVSNQNERGEDFQEQIGMPDEENMRHWSHHHDADTVDDPIFRAAMRGYDSVSFVFGLEVTWSLIQQRQQEEEERQAMLELEELEKHQNTLCADTETKKDVQTGSSDGTEEPPPPIHESSSKQSKALGDDSNQEDSEDDEAAWTLKRVYASSEIEAEEACLCNASEGCTRRACSIWNSDQGESMNCCADCQDEEFGGWPDALKPSQDHLGVIMALCSSGEDNQTESETGGPINDTSESAEMGMSPARKSDASSTDTEPCSESSQSSIESSPSTSIGSDEKSNTSAPPSSGWNCYACTFENKKAARKCGMCNTKRPKQKSKKRPINSLDQ